MLQKQTIQAIGGLNLDDDPRYLSENDYLKMLNFRVGHNQSQSDRGLIETFISHYEIALAPYLTILAVAKDEENDQAFILVFLDYIDDKFEIFKFNILTDAVTKIYSTDPVPWGINGNTKIYNPKILDGKLIWTDNVNSIKYIDLARLEMSYLKSVGTTSISQWNDSTSYALNAKVYWGKAYYKSLVAANNFEPGTDPTKWEYLCDILQAYGNITVPERFTLSANPPLISASPMYVNTAGRNVNQLRQRIFQVTYRYVYIDYRKSVYAPPSIVPAPSQEESIDGISITDQTYHNGLLITVNTGTEEVRTIEIIGRSSEDPTVWFLMGEILVFNRDGYRVISPNTTYDFYWYNDLAKSIADSSEVYTLFSYIPIKAKHMELIEGNRLAFANITEGYDRISQEVTVDISYEDLVAGNTEEIALSCQPVISDNVFPEPPYTYYLLLELPNTSKEGLYTIDIMQGTTHYTASYEWTGSGTYPLTVKNGLIAAITAAGWGAKIQTHDESTDYRIYLFSDLAIGGYPPAPRAPFWPGWDYTTGNKLTSAVLAVNKYPTLKLGSIHSWGFLYRDGAGRVSPIIGAGEITQYIPFPAGDATVNITKRAIIDFNINHLPPSWAKSYEIVYAGNRTTAWFLNLLAYNIQVGKNLNNHTSPALANKDTRNIRLSLEDMYTRTRDKMPSWSVEQYQWEKGDRIRIIGTVNSSGVVTELSYLNDQEITGVFVDTDYANPYSEIGTTIDREYLYFQKPVGMSPGMTPDSIRGFEDMLIEIYRPSKEFSTTIYFTTGMTFDVGTNAQGYKYHKGDTDQVVSSLGISTTPAIVRNTSHDGWKYVRSFMDKIDDNIHSIWIESMHASDFYLSQKMTSSGLPIPDLVNYKQTLLTKRTRHGGLYNYGTELNNIAKFDYNDFKDVKDEFGPIEGIREVGFILKIIQYNKISSIYISRKESFNASGEAEYLFTDSVFGSLRSGMEKYGSRHPESICVHNQHLYFWDHAEGAVIRDAANGVVPISSYKMMRFFTDKALAIDDSGAAEKDVYFAFDIANNTLLCTFNIGGVYETLFFSENDNRWKFTTDAKIKKPFWIGKRLYHIFGEKILQWWRDEGQGYLELSNEVKSASLIIAANQAGMKNKHFKAVAVYQDGDIPSGAIRIVSKASAVGRVMQSIIAAWELTEGIYYGKILGDLNTPGLAGSDNYIYMNGAKMRGQYAEITLNATKTTGKVRIFSVMITSTFSERSQ